MRTIYAFLFALTATSAVANSSLGNHDLKTDSIAPLQKDVSSIDGIVTALYDVISGPAGEKRNWDSTSNLRSPTSLEMDSLKFLIAISAMDQLLISRCPALFREE